MKAKKLLIFLSAALCLMTCAEAACKKGSCCAGRRCSKTVIIGGNCHKTWTVWTSKSKKKKTQINRSERPKKVEVNKKSIRTFYDERGASEFQNARRLGSR